MEEEKKKQDLMDTIISRINSGAGLLDDNVLFGVVKPDAVAAASAFLRLCREDYTWGVCALVWARCERARADGEPGARYEKRDGVAGLVTGEGFLPMVNMCLKWNMQNHENWTELLIAFAITCGVEDVTPLFGVEGDDSDIEDSDAPAPVSEEEEETTLRRRKGWGRTNSE
jgi:hypothetical protein